MSRLAMPKISFDLESFSGIPEANLETVKTTALKMVSSLEMANLSEPEIALKRIFQGQAPENVEITIIPTPTSPGWSWEEHLVKPVIMGSATVLGGIAIASSGPVGVGAGACTVLGYGTYKTVKWLTGW